MRKACIFDLDGTLAFTLDSMATVANQVLTELGLRELPTEKFKYYCEKNNIKIVETKYSENIIQKIELNEEEYNKLISKNMEINRQLPFKIKEIGILCRKFVEKVQ